MLVDRELNFKYCHQMALFVLVCKMGSNIPDIRHCLLVAFFRPFLSAADETGSKIGSETGGKKGSETGGKPGGKPGGETEARQE